MDQAGGFPEDLLPSPASRLQIWTPNAEPPPMSVPVTVLILTLNEIVNIERCIRSVGWAKQILVVDSGSTDGTPERAAQLGADVVHHSFTDYGAQRMWAMEHEALRHDWLMYIDADEWVSTDLAAAVERAVAAPVHAGFMVRVRFVFQGRWIRHAGWYRGRSEVRLFDRRGARVMGAISERVEVSGSIGALGADVVDEDRKPFSAWLAKHNNYSSVRARQVVDLRKEPVRLRFRRAVRARPRRRIVRELAKQVVLPHLPFTPMWTFLYLYLFRGGFLDGRVGLRFCSLHAFQQLAIALKVEENLRDEHREGT